MGPLAHGAVPALSSASGRASENEFSVCRAGRGVIAILGGNSSGHVRVLLNWKQFLEFSERKAQTQVLGWGRDLRLQRLPTHAHRGPLFTYVLPAQAR